MNSKARLNMRLTLILYALIPMIVTSIAVGVFSIEKSRTEIKEYTHDSLVQVIKGVGNTFDSMVNKNGEMLKSFAASPDLKDYLLDPGNAQKAAIAQQYTLDYFANQEGWEGIYLADWNSKVMTHPTEAVIGKVLREGDSLTSLQNSMLSAENGIYNTGIMESPASGQLIMSMYAPILVDGKPIGYVGCGFYVNAIADQITATVTISASNSAIPCFLFMLPLPPFLVRVKSPGDHRGRRKPRAFPDDERDDHPDGHFLSFPAFHSRKALSFSGS